jgi:hypothetical protein
MGVGADSIGALSRSPRAVAATSRRPGASLESSGAEVIEVVTYRWALLEDTAPLLRLIDALGRNEV